MMITTTTKTRLLALLAIGICDALRENKIEVLDAEHLLFSPRAMKQSAACDQRIIEIIHMGTELDDIKSLVPKDYESTINQIRKLALECLADANGSAVLNEDFWIDAVM